MKIDYKEIAEKLCTLNEARTLRILSHKEFIKRINETSRPIVKSLMEGDKIR